jgi:hypothetical protein
MTGLATFAVGFIPTYEQVGIWGAVILIIIRFIQGLRLGGEWGGSVLLGPPERPAWVYRVPGRNSVRQPGFRLAVLTREVISPLGLLDGFVA